MKIFIGIFLILFFGLLTSKIKINVTSLKDIKIGFYLFGVIKIFSFKLKNIQKLKKKNNPKVKPKVIFDILKILDIKLEKLHLDLAIGTEDVMVTVFLVTVISTVLSIISVKNNKNYYYKITPIYNENKVNIEILLRASVNSLDVIKGFQFMNKIKILTNNSVDKKIKESEKI